MAKHSKHVAHQSPVPDTFLDEFVRRFHAVASSGSFGDEYQKAEMLSKYLDPDPATGSRRRTAAITKWLRQEEKNRETNHRLIAREMRIGPYSWGDIVDTARGFIRRCIGDAPPPMWETSGSFTSGASTSVGRKPYAVPMKYQRGCDVTFDAVPHAFCAKETSDAWRLASPGYNVVRGNVLFTVPKNSDIDRCAAKEPDLNMYLQKALGGVIRRSLKRAGVDLSDQTRNRDLAREGSITGNLCTIDLSSASDSITTILVGELLPAEWFVCLDSCRSKETLVPTHGSVSVHWHYNQMFSSMGNAFTFELETLIFWALVRACCALFHIPGTISVYGDDIVCPSAAFGIVRAVFGFAGFTVNSKKSHHASPFRESCGGHYYGGGDVSPFYIRGPLKDLSSVIRLANQLRWWLTRDRVVTHDPEGYGLWSWVASHVPTYLHGGWDYENDGNLVRPGIRPTHRLVGRTALIRCSKVLQSDSGSFLSWLDAKEGAVSSEMVTSTFSRSLETKVSRVPKADYRVFGHCNRVFTDELGLTPQ